MANVIFKSGTKVQYEAIQPKDPNTLYWLTDEQALYKGDQLFGTGKAATQEAAGLLSAEDKKRLDDLVKGSVIGLTAVDGTIVIGDVDHGKTLKVGVSEKANNTIEVKSDGLFVGKTDVPKYEIEKKEEGAEGFAAVYRLKCTIGDSVTYSDVEINIPKDLVIKSGSLKVVEEKNVPYEGAEVGDPYLDIELNDEETTHIYIAVKGIVDTSNFVTSSIKTEKGEALIANDATGGGTWYRRTEDSLESYVGVNDGAEANGRPTPSAQIYAAKRDGSTIKDGSFINVYQDRITYNNRARMAAGAKNGDETSEIAVIADITASEDKAKVFYDATKYDVTGLLPGCRVDMNGKEIRVMFPKGAPFVKPSGTAEGRDNDCYYFGVIAYAPSDDVTGFKESNQETITNEPLENFDGPSSGVDKYGRKYDICWFPAAKWSEGDIWTYYGDQSEAGLCVGWYHTIEWYKDAECVGSETVRINLTNEQCHNSLKQSLGKDNSSNLIWEEM